MLYVFRSSSGLQSGKKEFPASTTARVEIEHDPNSHVNLQKKIIRNGTYLCKEVGDPQMAKRKKPKNKREQGGVLTWFYFQLRRLGNLERLKTI